MNHYKIEILNVGAIKEVKLNLNKINVFMGEQSSGKSTIAKLISFCNWVEKDVSIHQSFDEYATKKAYFIEKLELFHKMKGYFNQNSQIIYESDIIKLHYTWDDFEISWVNRFDYKRKKISYIPSERSMAVLPEMEKVELPNNYIKSFLFDWFDARKNYQKDNKISILNIDLAYYYSENNRESRIQNKYNSYDILLSQASSGVQSITPLVVMADYLIHGIYHNEQNLSYELDEARTKVNSILISELILKPIYGKDFTENEQETKEMLSEITKKLIEQDPETSIFFDKFNETKKNLLDTHSTHLIIEEPEQNLFPETQKNLIYHLLKGIYGHSEHHLTLTTHSPYVLYAINNCMMSHLVADHLSGDEKKNLPCLASKIDPKSVSIYQIKNGFVECIQEEDGLISDNFFDEQMKQVMDEFYLMLNHY